MNQETYVPGLSGGASDRGQNYASHNQNTNETLVGNAARIERNERMFMHNERSDNGSPVVGFVYTLSNNGKAEYWPIRIGVNTIGKASDNDICLSEASVSSHHAQINVKRLQRSGGKLAAGIKDVGSSNGVLLNDEELDYELHNCKNEDVITIGFNYKLVLVLIDPVKYGIGAADDFRATETEPSYLSAPLLDETVRERNIDNPRPIDPYMGEDETISINNPGANDISGGRTKIL